MGKKRFLQRNYRLNIISENANISAQHQKKGDLTPDTILVQVLPAYKEAKESNNIFRSDKS